MTPSETIEQAFLQLAFAVKLVTYAELGKFSRPEFDTDVLIKLERRNLPLRGGTFHSDDDIVLAAQNNFVLTLGFTVIVLDRALSEAGYASNLDGASPNRDLRALIYMVRCAFAHDMMNPRWEARGPFARELHVTLPSGVLLIDARALNEQPFDISHVGGYEGYWEIKEEIARMISKLNHANGADSADLTLARRGSLRTLGQ